jgi:hypothetical protein
MMAAAWVLVSLPPVSALMAMPSSSSSSGPELEGTSMFKFLVIPPWPTKTSPRWI